MMNFVSLISVIIECPGNGSFDGVKFHGISFSLNCEIGFDLLVFSIIHSSSSQCKDLLLSSHISVVLLNKFRVTCVSCFRKSYRKRRRRRRCAAAAVIAVTLTLSDVELLFASWAMES